MRPGRRFTTRARVIDGSLRGYRPAEQLSAGSAVTPRPGVALASRVHDVPARERRPSAGREPALGAEWSFAPAGRGRGGWRRRRGCPRSGRRGSGQRRREGREVLSISARVGLHPVLSRGVAAREKGVGVRSHSDASRRPGAVLDLVSGRSRNAVRPARDGRSQQDESPLRERRRSIRPRSTGKISQARVVQHDAVAELVQAALGRRRAACVRRGRGSSSPAAHGG